MLLRSRRRSLSVQKGLRQRCEGDASRFAKTTPGCLTQVARQERLSLICRKMWGALLHIGCCEFARCLLRDEKHSGVAIPCEFTDNFEVAYELIAFREPVG